MTEGAVVMVRSDWYKKWSDVEHFTDTPFPGVSLPALKFLHLERYILFHGHEPLDTDDSDDLEGEAWLMHHNFAQAEGVMNLDKVPEVGALVAIGYAKPLGGTGGFGGVGGVGGVGGAVSPPASSPSSLNRNPARLARGIAAASDFSILL